MKLNVNAHNFAQKILRIHRKDKDNSNNVPESLENKSMQSNSKNLTTASDKPETNNLVGNTNPNTLDQRRIVGGTDYKKFEDIARNSDIEEIKNDQKTKDALKMGCNNDFRKERQLLDKPSKDKIEASKLFKNEGDEMLKEKKYQEAINSYEKALLQLFYTFSDDLEQDKEVDRMKAALNMNVSMCKINLGKYEDAISCCNEALRVDNQNLKALYRIAFSYFKMEKFEEAKKQIAEGLKINSQEKLFEDLRKQIEDKEKENDLKASKMFKKILK